MVASWACEVTEIITQRSSEEASIGRASLAQLFKIKLD